MNTTSGTSIYSRKFKRFRDLVVAFPDLSQQGNFSIVIFTDTLIEIWNKLTAIAYRRFQDLPHVASYFQWRDTRGLNTGVANIFSLRRVHTCSCYSSWFDCGAVACRKECSSLEENILSTVAFSSILLAIPIIWVRDSWFLCSFMVSWLMSYKQVLPKHNFRYLSWTLVEDKFVGAVSYNREMNLGLLAFSGEVLSQGTRLWIQLAWDFSYGLEHHENLDFSWTLPFLPPPPRRLDF